MLIGTSGVVVDELAQVLLIRRNDTRTMAPPGGSLEPGELPPDSLAREVREETGLIVMPVRLVGLYFLPLPPSGMLTFIFRCIQRGGQLGPSPEAPVVAFFPSRQLPGPMLSFHRQRLEQALRHRGGPPAWVSQPFPWQLRLAKLLLDNLVYRYLDLRRAWQKQSPFQPPIQWSCSAHVVISDEQDRVFWQTQAAGLWQLPGEPCHQLEPPWRAAVRSAANLGLEVELIDLTGVYLQPDENRLQFVFTAHHKNNAQPAVSGAFFRPGQEPEGTAGWHLPWIADAFGPGEETTFRRQDRWNTRGDENHPE